MASQIVSETRGEIFLSLGWTTPLLGAILGLLIIRFLLKRPKNLPPGPTGIPILGYFPFLSRIPYMKMRDLSKKYGDVMSLNVVGTTVVHLGSYGAIRDAFVHQANEFSGRPTGFSFFRWIANNMGIAQAEGEEWKIHRRFALQTLRDFGFGKTALEERIREIAGELIQILEESNEQPIDVQELLANSTVNVMCSMLFGSHFKINDPVFTEIRNCVKGIIYNLPGSDAFLSGPLVKILPIKYVPKGQMLSDFKQKFYGIVEKLIDEHRATFDHTHPRDYVDSYLAEMRHIKLEGKTKDSTFTLDRLQTLILNLFIAGTESTANVIYWLLRYLMLDLDVQRKIQMELDQVVGKERLPSTLDRTNLPYTEAANNEALRMSTIDPLSLFHSNPEEVQFRGYTIPKRSIILANLWAIHFDPEFWPDPEKFDPTRFLSDDGKLIKRDSFFPFSAGKRFCLGETLARMELLLFPTSILQKFTLVPAPGDNDTAITLKPGFFRTVKPFKFCAIKRH